MRFYACRSVTCNKESKEPRMCIYLTDHWECLSILEGKDKTHVGKENPPLLSLMHAAICLA
eukprot:638198-Pelagomonas_calceolata.AAC.1